MIDTVLNYFNNSSAIAIGVIVLLSVYLIITFWIFIYKQIQLSNQITAEKANLGSLVSRDAKINPLSRIGQCVGDTSVSKEL
jgi:hypothetical protein